MTVVQIAVADIAESPPHPRKTFTKEAIAELAMQIEDRNDEIEVLRVKIEALRRKCPHSKSYIRSHYDGSNSTNCPSCGWSDG